MAPRTRDSGAPAPSAAAPAIAARDLVELARLALLLPVSWLVPARYWRSVAAAFAAIEFLFRRRYSRRRADHVRAVLGGAPAAASPEAIVAEGAAANYEDRLRILRHYRPGGWAPEIALVGREHIDAGLARGDGVALWIGHFVFSTYITKMALARAGFAVAHLSRPSHGFSPTRFGIRVLNPILTRFEDRYLRERITITPESARAVWKSLRRRLARNEIVSITVGDQARRTSRRKFLGGHIRLATGPAYLACSTGAELLPVFTVRTGYWTYTVHIEPPFETRDGGELEARIDAIMARYVALQEQYTLRYPGLWRHWSDVETE